MTIFVSTVFSFVVARNIIVSDLLQRTLSNSLAAWNPVSSSVLINSPAEVLTHCVMYWLSYS